MNLPNRLTVTRIILTVWFVVALLLPEDGAVRSVFPYTKTAALLLFIVASLTDWWDGWLARKHNIETSFGALLDPLADKILTTAAFICFIEQDSYKNAPLVQASMVLVIVARDFLVTGLRLVVSGHGMVLKAEKLGKHKTISQMITIIVTLTGLAVRDDWHCFGANVQHYNIAFSRIVFVMMLVTVVLTFVSGLIYFLKNREIFLRHA